MLDRQFPHSHDRLQLLLFETLAVEELDINKLTRLDDSESIIFVVIGDSPPEFEHEKSPTDHRFLNFTPQAGAEPERAVLGVAA